MAMAAYVAGERLWSEGKREHIVYHMREDVVFKRAMFPAGAPAWARDRNSLWNRVDTTARRRDARLAKVIEAAITRDVPEAMRAALVEEFAAPFVAMGCVADMAIHEDGTDHNPHVHIMLTTRQIEGDGFGAKITELEQKQFIKNVRKAWADITNTYLEKAGSALRVDHRSYKARGIEAVPTVHRGPDAMERREKREHARRVREEKVMAQPDRMERDLYPHLTARDHWPPEAEPTPDMSGPEREELHRYWQDRKLERIEEEARIEPDPGEQPEQERPMAAEPRRSWYEIGRKNAYALAEREPVAERDDGSAFRQEMEQRQRDYDRGVWERAVMMPRTREEHEALQLARRASPQMLRVVEERIFDARVMKVREDDIRRKERELERMMEPSLRDKVRELFRREEEPERVQDPVPGPNWELMHPEELERAQEQAREEYERERER